MSKFRCAVYLLLVFLMTGPWNPAPAFAQDKDRNSDGRRQNTEEEAPLSRREERKRLKEERRRQKAEDRRREEDVARAKYDSKYARPAGTTNAPFKYPPTVIKPRYRIHVLASLYLDELVKSKKTTGKDAIPDKAQPGIAVYEGVSIAADSLKRAGYNIDIYFHDITTTEESIDSLIAKSMLDSADLIIGAIAEDAIPRIAEYAHKKKVNFVSTLAASDAGVKNNKYFTLLQPSLKHQCLHMVREIADKYPGAKVSILYRSNNEANENAYKYIINWDDLLFRQRLCNTLPDKKDLGTFFDLTSPNIIIMPFFEPAFADSLLRRLSKDFPATHFEVYGMSSWVAIKNLRKENAYPNLAINIPATCNIDYTSATAKYVIRNYKESFGHKPADPVFCAFENMVWYARLLTQYGTMFNTSYSDNTAAPFTRFNIRQMRDADGRILYNENRNILISRYEGGNVRTQ